MLEALEAPGRPAASRGAITTIWRSDGAFRTPDHVGQLHVVAVTFAVEPVATGLESERSKAALDERPERLVARAARPAVG